MVTRLLDSFYLTLFIFVSVATFWFYAEKASI